MTSDDLLAIIMKTLSIKLKQEEKNLYDLHQKAWLHLESVEYSHIKQQAHDGPVSLRCLINTKHTIYVPNNYKSRQIRRFPK